MTAQRRSRGRGQDFSRVGGILVTTDAQRRALELMSSTLGAALARSSRIEKMLSLLAIEVAACAQEINAYNSDAHVQRAGAQLDVLAESLIGCGHDFELLVLRDLARRLACPEAVNGERPLPPEKLELHHVLDRVRGIAMRVLTGEARA